MARATARKTSPLLQTLARIDALIEQDKSVRLLEAAQRREEDTKRREEEAKQRALDEAAFRREMNRERGEFSRQLGTLVEDMVAPSVARVTARVFDLSDDDPVGTAVRVRRKLVGGRSQEYDVVATWPGHVLVVQTKNRLRPEDVPEVVALTKAARDFLPEYADRTFHAALASLYIEESLLRHAERNGVVVMGLGDHLMDPYNSDGFVPADL